MNPELIKWANIVRGIRNGTIIATDTLYQKALDELLALIPSESN